MSTLMGIIPLAISWEEVSPLVFLVVYFVVQWIFNSKKKQAEQELESAPNQEESAAAERARRLQEEIRRRIAEKMREVQEAAQESAKEESVRPMERKVEAARPIEAPRETPRAMPQAPAASQQSAYEPTETASFSTTSEETSSVSQDLLARLEAIRAAQAPQMDDSQRSAASAAAAYTISKPKLATDAADRRAILQSELKDADSIKRAFIMSELLGKPVSLR